MFSIACNSLRRSLELFFINGSFILGSSFGIVITDGVVGDVGVFGVFGVVGTTATATATAAVAAAACVGDDVASVSFIVRSLLSVMVWPRCSSSPPSPRLSELDDRFIRSLDLLKRFI